MKESIQSLIRLTVFSLALSAPAFAEDPDPMLTENSTETFTVDMGGFPLSLPIELKSRAVPKKVSKQQTDLSIGGLDIVYEIKDKKTGTITPVKSWVDFQGGSSSCNVEKRLDTTRENFAKYDIRSRIEQVSNDKFKGYLIHAEYVQKSAVNGLFLEVYDKTSSTCYTVSLAVESQGNFTMSQIRTSLSPLLNAIEESMVDYSMKGAER